MKYKKRRFQLITRLDLAVLLGIVLAVFLSNVAAFGQECDAVRADVVRLHILANSDSPADQQVKLRVRDRILADVGGVFAGPQTQADAKEAARQNLPAIESAARAALDEAGVDAPVRAELCRMYFTTRQYDDLMLPAGRLRRGARHDRRGRGAQLVVRHVPAHLRFRRHGRGHARLRGDRDAQQRAALQTQARRRRGLREALWKRYGPGVTGKPGRGHRAPAF